MLHLKNFVLVQGSPHRLRGTYFEVFVCTYVRSASAAAAAAKVVTASAAGAAEACDAGDTEGSSTPFSIAVISGGMPPPPHPRSQRQFRRRPLCSTLSL